MTMLKELRPFLVKMESSAAAEAVDKTIGEVIQTAIDLGGEEGHNYLALLIVLLGARLAAIKPHAPLVADNHGKPYE